MPERSTATQAMQVGAESLSTPGTSVAASKLLTSLYWRPMPQQDYDTFGATGAKFDAINIIRREWTEGDLQGFLTYNEIVYPFNSLLGVPTITTPSTGTTSRQWEYIPTVRGVDSLQTFTTEIGDANFAEKTTGVFINGMDLGFSVHDGLSLAGKVMGGKLATGITLTGSPTALTPVPVAATQVSVYVDPPGANNSATDTALGTTKLTRVDHVNLSLGNRQSGFYPVNATQAGAFAATVQNKPAASGELTVMADTTGMAFLANARAGDTRMLRIEAVGALIETTITYKLTLDCAIQINGAATYGDVDGAETITYPFALVDAGAAWASKAFRARVVNVLTAL